jgi:hypothetical protein
VAAQKTKATARALYRLPKKGIPRRNNEVKRVRVSQRDEATMESVQIRNVFTAILFLCTLAPALRCSAIQAIPGQAEPVKRWESFDFRRNTVTSAELKDLTVLHLKYLRGTVFGRHGRVFQEAAIQDWLKTRPWYTPNPKYALSDLNDTERANMDAIKEAEYHKHKNIEPGDLKFYRTRTIARNELGTHSRVEWLIMREEIEAIHGKQFIETPWLQSFFDERYWYHPNPKYAPSMLSDTERANIQTIAAAQKEGRGLALAPGDMEQFQETPITADLLKGLSLFELRLLRNEVYARHGMRFHTDWIQQHFEAEPWYHANEDYREPKLGAVEAKNVELIVKAEQRLHEDLATKPISPAVINGLYLEDARKLRNEIYARHGLIFKDKWLDSYFRSMSWYRPDPNYRESKLSDVERRNVNALLIYERGAKKAADSLAA